MTFPASGIFSGVAIRYFCEHSQTKSRVLALVAQAGYAPSLQAVLTCTDRAVAEAVADALDSICADGLTDDLREKVTMLEGLLPAAPAASLRQAVASTAELASTGETKQGTVNDEPFIVTLSRDIELLVRDPRRLRAAALATGWHPLPADELDSDDPDDLVGAVDALTDALVRVPGAELVDFSGSSSRKPVDDDDPEDDEVHEVGTSRHGHLSEQTMSGIREKAARFPGDANDIVLHFESSQNADGTDILDNPGVEAWSVSIMLEPLDEVPIQVGLIDIKIVDRYECPDPVEALDALSFSLCAIGEAIFDLESGELKEKLDLVGLGGQVLILDRVELVEQWRGYGVGVLAAGMAIKRLGRNSCLAACYPGSTATDQSKQARLEAAAKLAQTWRVLGFEDFTPEVQVLNLDLAYLDNALKVLREAFSIDG